MKKEPEKLLCRLSVVSTVSINFDILVHFFLFLNSMVECRMQNSKVISFFVFQPVFLHMDKLVAGKHIP